MRGSFDGLYAITRQQLGQDPLGGGLFVFVNRRGTQMKVLHWDRSRLCIWAKRLEQGRFVSDWSKLRTREMDWTGLKLLIEGIEARVVRKRYRAVALCVDTVIVIMYIFTRLLLCRDLPCKKKGGAPCAYQWRSLRSSISA